jgi:hypothetical protein
MLAKILMFIGLLVFVTGLLLAVLTRWGIPLGALPGDFRWESERSVFYFPLATSLIVSIVLTLLLNLLLRFFR